jgi:hypothetical protein
MLKIRIFRSVLLHSVSTTTKRAKPTTKNDVEGVVRRNQRLERAPKRERVVV